MKLNKAMSILPKYHVVYALEFKHHREEYDFRTDDPVACEEFLSELIERKVRIVGIRHDGVDIAEKQFTQMIRNAAGMVATRHICASLNEDYEAVHHRFGFAA